MEGVYPQGSGSSRETKSSAETHPMVFLGGALALTSCSTMNFCNCHPLGTEPRDNAAALRPGPPSWGVMGAWGGCSALKPAEVSNPLTCFLLLPRCSYGNGRPHHPATRFKVWFEDLGNTWAWLSSAATLLTQTRSTTRFVTQVGDQRVLTRGWRGRRGGLTQGRHIQGGGRVGGTRHEAMGMFLKKQ